MERAVGAIWSLVIRVSSNATILTMEESYETFTLRCDAPRGTLCYEITGRFSSGRLNEFIRSVSVRYEVIDGSVPLEVAGAAMDMLRSADGSLTDPSFLNRFLFDMTEDEYKRSAFVDLVRSLRISDEVISQCLLETSIKEDSVKLFNVFATLCPKVAWHCSTPLLAKKTNRLLEHLWQNEALIDFDYPSRREQIACECVIDAIERRSVEVLKVLKLKSVTALNRIVHRFVRKDDADSVVFMHENWIDLTTSRDVSLCIPRIVQRSFSKVSERFASRSILIRKIQATKNFARVQEEVIKTKLRLAGNVSLGFEGNAYEVDKFVELVLWTVRQGAALGIDLRNDFVDLMKPIADVAFLKRGKPHRVFESEFFYVTPTPSTTSLSAFSLSEEEMRTVLCQFQSALVERELSDLWGYFFDTTKESYFEACVRSNSVEYLIDCLKHFGTVPVKLDLRTWIHGLPLTPIADVDAMARTVVALFANQSSIDFIVVPRGDEEGHRKPSFNSLRLDELVHVPKGVRDWVEVLWNLV